MTLVRIPYSVSHTILIWKVRKYGVNKRIAGKIGWIARFKE